MAKGKFYITTAIDYPSGRPHMGHCYEKVCADVLARWFRLLNGKDNVFFMTGLDEHGLKIQRKAEERGLEPKEYVDMMSKYYYQLCEAYDISFDHFIRTTDESHIKFCQDILQKVYDKGDIYKGIYEGPYCVDCETYYTESELIDGKCPVHGKPCEQMKEESYFFRMGKYQKQVEAYLKSGYLLPPQRTKLILNRMKEGVRDLCISRSTFTWGVPLPFDNEQYSYVWFDALLNYASGVSEPSLFRKFWPPDLHLIGHDIIWHHTVIWLSMLLSAGLELPKNLFAHGFINAEGGVKMSKSLGNVIDPLEIVEEFPSDTIRYFLLREVPFGSDGAFSRKALVARHNNELANDLGNLLQRTTVMVGKYFGGTVPEKCADELSGKLDFKAINNLMEKYEIHTALSEIWKFVNECNRYINDEKPWELAKSDKARLEVVVYNLAESLRIISILLSPFMPDTARNIAVQLGITDASELVFENLAFGRLSGKKIPEPKILFEKIDDSKEEDNKMEKSKPISTPEAEHYIPFKEWEKMVLRVGKVVKAEPHPKADKLYVLLVDLGPCESDRQVVAGIREHYKMEDLVGKKVTIFCNLQPTVIRGIESNGMLLAAEGKKDEVALLVPDRDVIEGARIH